MIMSCPIADHSGKATTGSTPSFRLVHFSVDTVGTVFSFDIADKEENTCAICLSPICSNETMSWFNHVELQHTFHHFGIHDWLLVCRPNTFVNNTARGELAWMAKARFRKSAKEIVPCHVRAIDKLFGCPNPAAVSHRQLKRQTMMYAALNLVLCPKDPNNTPTTHTVVLVIREKRW